MKLSEIKKGQKFVEIKPSKHTEKLQQIEVLSIRTHYEHNHKTGKSQNYTYIYYKTCEGTYYPASNRGKDGINEYAILDGLIGCIKIKEFNKKFALIN